jgi:hypothetical protein
VTTPLDCWELTFDFILNRAGTDEDHAQFSVWIDGDGTEPDDANLHSLAIGAHNAWTANVPHLRWCNNVRLGSVSATSFLANGHILRQQEYAGDDAWAGTAADPALPWETSQCVSLYTYPRGTFVSQSKRKRGRIYMPPMAGSMLDSSNSGYFPDGNMESQLGYYLAFLSAVNQDMEGVPVGTLSIFSRMDSLLRPVTHVYLDAKYDSQRRRQNRETVGYIGGTLA